MTLGNFCFDPYLLLVTASWASACAQDLENQMHIAEQKRRTLLKDFHDT